MHYRNGREAKNGDKIVLVDLYSKNIVTGILYDAVPGNDHCNGRLAPISSNDACPNLTDCLHLDDVKAVLGDPAQVPDTTKGAS